jgi:hypothetical protein
MPETKAIGFAYGLIQPLKRTGDGQLCRLPNMCELEVILEDLVEKFEYKK